LAPPGFGRWCPRSVLFLWVCGLLLGAARPSLHAQHRFTRLHSFGATNPAPMLCPAFVIEGSDGAFYGTHPTALVKLNSDGTGYTLLHSFVGTEGDDVFAWSLLEGTDGALYGITRYGDSNTWGTVFKVNRDGSDFVLLYPFQGGPGDGSSPEYLLEGTDGRLYGTTGSGGREGSGTLYRLNKNGSGYAVLHHFTGEDGWGPVALVQGSDGALHGTARAGGTNYHGTVFTLNKDGTGFAVLRDLSYFGDDGTIPVTLIEGSDGALYGATEYGGSHDGGTVFKLNKDGTSFAILHSFAGGTDDGRWPAGALLEGDDDALYGRTQLGGSNNLGVVFRLNKDGTGFSLLCHAPRDIIYPQPFGNGLVMGSDGTLYGTTPKRRGQGTLFRLNRDGTDYQQVVAFPGSVSYVNGAVPRPVVIGPDQALYGTTQLGGSDDFGTVFWLSRDGTGYTSLHSFTGGANDGRHPEAGVVVGQDGILYGTTRWGGVSDAGTVFRLGTNGSDYEVLHNFSGGPNDGAFPIAPLVPGSDGALYGTTVAGGSNDGGTVFKLNRHGSGYKLLHSLPCSDTDLVESRSTVVEGRDGALYGTTRSGGNDGVGTVFRLNKDGSGYALLHSFSYSSARCPIAPLLEASDGMLYGTTSLAPDGGSAVFRLSKDGANFQVILVYPQDASAFGYGALLEGSDGDLYGTIDDEDNGGAVFKMKKDGTGFCVLWTLSRVTDGEYPLFGVIEDSGGALYGTAIFGGDMGCGTVFRLELAPVLFNSVWNGSIFSFQFNARSNVVYQPQFKSSLADLPAALRSAQAGSNWTALPTITGQRGVVTVTDTNLPAAPRFYRVVTP
jgi:uncharacterized repeat protein (TIGR03803 family)